MVRAQATLKAEQSPMKSPNRVPLPSELPTMTRMPAIISAMVTSVTVCGRSFRNIHESKAANMELKAMMKTMLAVEVLKTPATKVTAPMP